mgnify:CR=1 FL=1
MKKIASLLIFSILISLTSVNLTYGKRYKYSHSYEYKYYKYESFRPLIWAGAIYIGILSVKEIVFIPEERKYKEKELELLNLEIEKKKRELEFIYNPPAGWDTTPWGIKFMKDLSTRYYFEE